MATGTAVELEGFHAVKHALRFSPASVRSVTVTSRSAAAELCFSLAPDIAASLLTLAKVGPVQHPTGISGTAVVPPEDRSVLSARRSPLLLLDDPRHPGNAGAAVRVAAAAGACGVGFLGALDPWSTAVVRGAAGLTFALPVLSCRIEEVTGPLVVLDTGGERMRSLPDDAAVVVGSERAGVSHEVRDRADLVLSLPMREGVSSLNLATAASAVLYAWRLPRD